jgi:hypothetical protein
MSLSPLELHHRPRHTAIVFRRRHWLEVVRINACAVAAKVIDHKAGRYLANQMLIGPPMSHSSCAPESAIAVETVCLPLPAIAAGVDLGPEQIGLRWSNFFRDGSGA